MKDWVPNAANCEASHHGDNLSLKKYICVWKQKILIAEKVARDRKLIKNSEWPLKPGINEVDLNMSFHY
jgi:hypothetical protein